VKYGIGRSWGEGRGEGDAEEKILRYGSVRYQVIGAAREQARILATTRQNLDLHSGNNERLFI
jgi:hypothetical protein